MVITLQNVGYKYGERSLFRDVSLMLTPGSFHFLTGPSGSGKTTFMRLVTGELAPSSGHVSLFGCDPQTTARDVLALHRQRIGIVHQSCQFIDHLTLVENVTLALKVRKRAINPSDVTELLTWVGLAPVADMLPPTLSVGERQRTALARAIITNPDIILADEPTGNLDWEMSLRLMHLLVELNRLGKTVLMATHDLTLIRHVKNQIKSRILRIRDQDVQLAGADL